MENFGYLLFAELSSVSAAVAVLPERGQIPRAIQEKYTHLTCQCILTPYNAPTINMTVVPLSKYIEDRGQPPSVVDSSLILRDVRKAISYLKSKSVTKFKVTEDQIALQLVSFYNLSSQNLISYMKPNS